MKIQSLSIVVPGKKCINNCRFCVSQMRVEEYPNYISNPKDPFYDLRLADYLKRLEFARDNGCNTVMLTGSNIEPQQNRGFLKDFGLFMKLMERPFRNIEMQTTGVLLDENYLRFLRNHVGVTTISISLASLLDDQNSEYCNLVEKVNIKTLCQNIKKYGFNLRLSLNLTDYFNAYNTRTESFFSIPRSLGADQITFRVLYKSPSRDTRQDIWINEHSANPWIITQIREYIEEKGRALEILEYGATRYSVDGMSTVLDEDCMSKEAKESLKFLILRPDCKLYSKWDDPASLIF